MLTDTTRKPSAIPSRFASRNRGSRWAILAAYVAIAVVVTGLAAAGVDGLSVHIDPAQIAIWIILVAGAALGFRLAWYLLTATSLLVVLFAAIAFANQDHALGRLAIVVLSMMQVALLFLPRMRPE